MRKRLRYESDPVDEMEQELIADTYAFVKIDEESIPDMVKDMKHKGKKPLVINFVKEYDSVDYMVENYSRYRFHSDKPETFFYKDTSKFYTGLKFLKLLLGDEISEKDYETGMMISFCEGNSNAKNINYQYLFNSEISFYDTLSTYTFLDFYK